MIPPDEDLPKLPVARAVWVPRPTLKVAATAWIYAGGAHHTGFSQAFTIAYCRDFAEIARIELIKIDGDTSAEDIRQQLRWNDSVFG